jgi:hypothetical protein
MPLGSSDLDLVGLAGFSIGPGKIGRGWKTGVRIEATAWMYVLHGFFLYDFLGWGWESSWVG